MTSIASSCNKAGVAERRIGSVCYHFNWLNHDAIENTHGFSGAIGNGNRFTPRAYFRNAESMLAENMRSYVVFGANDENGEDAWISVIEMIEIDEGINHDCGVLSLIGVAKIENRAVILPQIGIAK